MKTEPVTRSMELVPLERLLELCLARMAAANEPPFRGEIWEDDANIGLSQDAAHGNKPFDINSCIYWKPALQKGNHPDTRMIVITAANQLAKTLVCELIARHKIKHDPAHMVLYDQTIEASVDHMKTRFMPFLKSIPKIGTMIDEVLANNRFEATTTDILLPGMILRGRPLNEMNTQRITVRYMFIHDAAVPGENTRNGMIRKARVRLTQFLGRELLVVESQGGVMEGDQPDDFTMLVAETDDADLWVTCPACGRAQIFTLPGWSRRRADDFVPVPPKAIPSLDHVGWVAHHRELLLMPERRVAGFKRGDELLARMGDGLFHEKDILAHTYYECHDCGSPWYDDAATREVIQQSSHFVPTNITAAPGKYGYRVPAWISPRLSWGLLMFEKVVADNAARVGNDLLIQEWETKRAAATYDPRRHMATVASVAATVDPLVKIPDELFRGMEVDCQKDKQLSAIKGEDMTGHFWVTAFATDKRGNDVQLWRGYCVTWEEWINKAKELKIPTKNISVDVSYKPDEVKSMAARHAEIVCEKCDQPQREGKFPCSCRAGGIYATWTMMRGSDQKGFRWPEEGVVREYRVEKPEEATVYSADGRSRVVRINLITWSNFRFKSILNHQLSKMPGLPSLTRLPDKSALLTERTWAMETDNCTWDNQMNSELIDGKKSLQFVPVHKENHYRDCCCMHIVRKMQAGVAGRMEVTEDEAQRVNP